MRTGARFGVEAQYVVSTMKVVDTSAEQKVLEEILEEGKPPIPDPFVIPNLISVVQY